MGFCTDKEQESCNFERMGCDGCYYNNPKNLIESLEKVKDRNKDLEIELLKLKLTFKDLQRILGIDNIYNNIMEIDALEIYDIEDMKENYNLGFYEGKEYSNENINQKIKDKMAEILDKSDIIDYEDYVKLSVLKEIKDCIGGIK